MTFFDKGKRMVTITINKNQYQAQEDELLLHALMRLQIDIPHLCSEKMFETYGGCQLCLVDVVTCGKTTMTPACTIRIKNGLEILTDTPRLYITEIIS
jgi:NADH dehydrogenase/NADH:ubiquinone oxidoreductase subunit G